MKCETYSIFERSNERLSKIQKIFILELKELPTFTNQIFDLGRIFGAGKTTVRYFK